MKKMILVILFVPALMHAQTQNVRITSGEWELVGDLVVPEGVNMPVVLLLHKANGTREELLPMAEALHEQGIATLRLDLRGHGESINMGKFVPYEVPRSPLIWDAEQDVVAAVDYLKRLDRIDPNRIGVLAGSYSGEEAAEAGRLAGFAKAYVQLSPGSLSAESIAAMDGSGARWLFVACREEKYLQEINAQVFEETRQVEMLLLPGTAHASRILDHYPEMNDRLAYWFGTNL